jgi:hypothetical protein
VSACSSRALAREQPPGEPESTASARRLAVDAARRKMSPDMVRRGATVKAATWAGLLSLVVGCASADSMSSMRAASMRAESAAASEGSVSVADCERFCGAQTPIVEDNWCRCESIVASSPAVRRTLYQPAASKRVTSGATCASQADCQGAHESCVRSDPTSTTGQCESVPVPRNGNRHARVNPSG